jgi:hypothetical protein
MPNMDSETQDNSVGCSPYRVPAPSPKDPPVVGLEVQPALVVFVLLVLAGLVFFFREGPNCEHDGGRLSIVESPMLGAYSSPYGQATRGGFSLGAARGARQHPGIGRTR